MNNKLIKYYEELLQHVEYYNNMAPFNIFDSEYVELIRNKLNELKEMEEDYDDLPVAACKFCKSLHIEVDDVDNDRCMRCGSINDLIIYKNIEEYLNGIAEQE